MKIIITAFLLLLSVSAFAQDQTIGNKHNKVTANGKLDADSGTYSKGIPTLTVKDSTAFVTPYYFSTHVGVIDSVGGTITGTPAIGQVIAKGSASDFIRSAYYPTQAPTASLSGGSAMEKHSSGTFTGTLNYVAGRQAATQPLHYIVVAGDTETFSQPAAPGTVSGTQTVTVTYNTNTSFSNIVWTTDNKTATATTTFSFLTKYYAGFVSSAITAPTDGQIQGLSNQFLNSSRTQGNATYTPSGSQKLVIAFDQALDPSGISTIWISGLDQTGAFTRTVRSYTNASGFTYNIIIFILTNPTAGAITFNIQ